MVTTIDIKQVIHMKEGTDETSYAKTSYIQKQVLSLTKHIKEKAMKEFYCKNQPATLCIADMGCSSANSLNVVFDLIVIVDKARRELGKGPQDYQIYLNDLPGNDFNTIFRSLGSFKDMLKQHLGDDFGRCYINGVPGTFYGRLFPENHLQFVHSSYSLQWLSQVPEDIMDNKGNIYIAKTSPSNVLEAYYKQFQKDFSMFLQCRSEEVVEGGIMVLTILGRKSSELYSKESSHMFDLLATALKDMVSEGFIDEDKLNTSNIPNYTPSEAELRFLVEKEGSFVVNQIHISEVNWEADDNCENSSKAASSHYDFVKCMRSVTEPLLINHFGESIIEELFLRYTELVRVSMAKEKSVFINITLWLTRKG
ncbi:salicylate carboxymethyltransferase-like [Chenopodium quinoa]|uniref:salicylate carboxymethyltransferase-like n=1 Tax=Chenopodium quinoa TaxID=63459 RepID=UPI000B78A4C6|nr:salicylate carboxymethyltransferase-like [Chenopodium quinoa]